MLKRLPMLYGLMLLLSTNALVMGVSAAELPDINGTWKPLNGDDRVMTIKLLEGKITIEATDLSCTLSDLQAQKSALPSVASNGVCYDESDTFYAKDTLTVLRVGKEIFLLEASVLQRHVNENADPKIDEAVTDQPATIAIYRKIRKR